MSLRVWSTWNDFPDPDKGETLIAPIGPGIYRLRNKKTGEWVLCGESKSVCYRMASLLPKGPGTRKSLEKRNCGLHTIGYFQNKKLKLAMSFEEV